MIWAIGLGLLQWVVAYLALDLTFRRINLAEAHLRGEVKRWHRRFAVTATAVTIAGGALQVGLAGFLGLLLALVGPLPWWLLWRFGWRKQFTFLFVDDGGKSR